MNKIPGFSAEFALHKTDALYKPPIFGNGGKGITPQVPPGEWLDRIFFRYLSLPRAKTRRVDGDFVWAGRTPRCDSVCMQVTYHTCVSEQCLSLPYEFRSWCAVECFGSARSDCCSLPQTT
jgi:hypothetical protein